MDIKLSPRQQIVYDTMKEHGGGSAKRIDSLLPTEHRDFKSASGATALACRDLIKKGLLKRKRMKLSGKNFYYEYSLVE